MPRKNTNRLTPRYRKAEKALGPYREDARTTQKALADLLTDLRHLSDLHGIDFHLTLDQSYQQYLTEKAQEGV